MPPQLRLTRIVGDSAPKRVARSLIDQKNSPTYHRPIILIRYLHTIPLARRKQPHSRHACKFSLCIVLPKVPFVQVIHLARRYQSCSDNRTTRPGKAIGRHKFFAIQISHGLRRGSIARTSCRINSGNFFGIRIHRTRTRYHLVGFGRNLAADRRRRRIFPIFCFFGSSATSCDTPARSLTTQRTNSRCRGHPNLLPRNDIHRSTRGRSSVATRCHHHIRQIVGRYTAAPIQQNHLKIRVSDILFRNNHLVRLVPSRRKNKRIRQICRHNFERPIGICHHIISLILKADIYHRRATIALRQCTAIYLLCLGNNTKKHRHRQKQIVIHHIQIFKFREKRYCTTDAI